MSDHVHKYYRTELGKTRVVRKDGKRYLEKKPGYPVFKCALPGCPHFIARELAIGRKSVCWKCNGEMVLNMENTTLKKPTHKECRRGYEEEAA